VAKVIEEFEVYFGEPQGLLPHRPFNHHIQLLPRAKPVSVRPYRYTAVQKDEMEKQIKEMLRKGIIKLSHIPFVSPVLLVKKKGWMLAVLCQLSTSECNHSEGQISNAHSRRAV
jgi:hypothetical protein